MRDLVTDAYKQELKKLHENNNSFGVGSVTSKHYSTIQKVIDRQKILTLLDYGCGKGHFIKYAKETMPDLKVKGFDVASDEYNILPSEKFDMVVCLDVMEHVEFGALSNVLSEIRDRTSRIFLCSVANYPAAKVLSDGRNAHVTQIPFGYWFTMFSGFFRVDQFLRTGKAEGLFICSALKMQSDWR